jgi:phosphoglycerol transferase
MLTTGTHANAGYLDKESKIIYHSKFKNALADMDAMLAGFVAWLKEQDFYENTTVVILGDHLFYNTKVFDIQRGLSERKPLNIFINSLLKNEYTKNRQFSHFDIFPVILQSIGISATIDGIETEGLALGRFINKGVPSLLELLGVNEMETGLKNKSAFYNAFLY